MQQRAKLDGGGDGGGGVSGGGSGVGGSGVGSTGSVGSANGGDCGGSAGGITTTTPNNNNNNSSAGRGQGPGSAGSGSSNSSNNSNTFCSNGSSSSSHGLGKHTAPQDLRAHVHAAQLAALSHAAGLGHLGQFSPRDLKLDIHPLRAAGVLPTHGPFSQSGGTPPERYPRPLAQTPQPPSSLQSSPEPGSEGRSHHWTFEEQFKQVQVLQLYELSDDPQRKEFLDDLFAFMQKRGTPVNRIPIMAKQTLDLYELFRLVVSKGGLVEVINKKLWREITKGLNLPSSITSAAFTLRTQYMKYLYPYECDKLKLSSPQELQAAIDGNRREGRRSSYGYDLSPGPTLVPTSHHLNGSLLNGKLGRGSPVVQQPLRRVLESAARNRIMASSITSSGPVGEISVAHTKSCAPPSGPPPLDQQSGSLAKLSLFTPDDDDSPPPTPHPPPQRGLTERDALAMEAASRAMEEATRKMEAARLPPLDTGSPPRKRLLSEDDRLLAHAGMPSAHLKITSRNDGRSDIDNSLVVSMEVNGVMYQGVLFAQHNRRI
ncbi:protein dead ringer homolog [Pomacea canaliculata]|uniref:protein dead ringer homolog n=1 Tax=Pomacea canaliculata TaxID=400727 RepID=UPI000D72A620|nr:protein dead ringer homolog [Pomacea canaliculata]